MKDEELSTGAHLLPGWFVPRMMTDVWSFAFVMVDGTVVHLTHVERVDRAADGSLWLTVALADARAIADGFKTNESGHDDFCAPTSRSQASINAAHIMIAYETADT